MERWLDGRMGGQSPPGARLVHHRSSQLSWAAPGPQVSPAAFTASFQISDKDIDRSAAPPGVRPDGGSS